MIEVSQEHQSRVREIIALSLVSLRTMYDENALRFCYALQKGSRTKGKLSFRYTAIVLLGLDQARRCSLAMEFPVDDICADLALHASEEHDLGNKALALWATLKLRSPLADKALSALLDHGGWINDAREGLVRSTELAWTVYALALAWEDAETSGEQLLSPGTKDRLWGHLQQGMETLRALRNCTTGLFPCIGLPHGNRLWRDKLKTTSGFFDSQVYGAMALAQAGKALGRGDLLHEARHVVLAVLKHQGSYGEWPWHYDVRTGTVIDPYPIFSVHQDGMGPMMLLEVGEALKLDLQEAIEKSLAWVFGANELRLPMIDPQARMIWRAQHRQGLQQYILQANRIAHHYRLPLVARVLRAAPGRAIEYECRPYHLGWILYAFYRSSQLMSETTDGNPHTRPIGLG